MHPTAARWPKVKFWHPEFSNINPKAVIGEGSTIHSHVWISHGVKIGRNVKIQAFTYIPAGVFIEDDVFIGPRVTFTNDPRMEMDQRKWAVTKVCRGAKLGASVTIRAGVTIGENAIIGAGAVVLSDVPAATTYAGVPAERIK